MSITRPSTLAGLLGALAVAGCAEAPENPTWTGDVLPILEANCVRCHGAPAIGGAPAEFRLDVYEDTVTDDGRSLRGAGAMAEFIVTRVEDGSMPPRFPLDDHQVETLRNWYANRPDGLGMRPPRGEPAPGNGAPTMTLLNDPGAAIADDRTTIEYEIRDPDFDIVTGRLLAGADDRVLTRELYSGRGTVAVDLAGVPEGTYALRAVLDDGSGETTVELGDVTVSRSGNAAPRVALATPLRDAILADRDSPVDLALEVSDLDVADVLTADIVAFRRGEDDVTVASDAPVTAATATIPWDTSGVPAGSGWRLRVTVSDGTDTRTIEGGPFTISHTSTTETWDSISDIFAFKCAVCHGAARVPGLTHNFSSYETAGEVLGVYDLRGLIYRRVVQEQNMPPRSQLIAAPNSAITAEERERLESWLLGGAPQ